MRLNGNYGLLPNSSFKSRPAIRAKKDTAAKERAVNAITGELVCTACCRLVNYYNCEVPAIFRLALVHQRYIPTYRPADTAQRFSIQRAGPTPLRARAPTKAASKREVSLRFRRKKKANTEFDERLLEIIVYECTLTHAHVRQRHEKIHPIRNISREKFFGALDIFARANRK